jgi:hypothetical protein
METSSYNISPEESAVRETEFSLMHNAQIGGTTCESPLSPFRDKFTPF